MYKQFITGLMMILVSSWAIANTGGPALTTTGSTENEIVLPITLNNQANVDIKTNSTLIPKSAQSIAPQGAEVFDLKVPAEVGIKRIRYSNDVFGCDFYITVSLRYNPSNPTETQPVAFLAPVPINSDTTCNMTTVGGVNHLSVSFFKLVR